MSEASGELRGKRVLIVEDESLILLTLEEIVEGLGCEIAGTAVRADAALAILHHGAVDLALLDVNLGHGMTSYPVADLLAERGIPFAFVTGYGPGSVRPEYSGRPVLAKPVDERCLEAAMRALLGAAPGRGD